MERPLKALPTSPRPSVDASQLTPIWNKYLALTKLPNLDDNDKLKLILLGHSIPELPKALSDLHLILWKFVIIHFTLVDLKNQPFDHETVWKGAIRRYASKVNSLEFQASLARINAEANLTKFNYICSLNKLLSPLAAIDETGVTAHPFGVVVTAH